MAATLIGVLGVVLGTSLTAAQWWRARTTTAGVSVMTWRLYLAVNVTAAVYGAGGANMYLCVAGIAAAAFNVALLCRLEHPWWLPVARTVGVAAAAVTVGVVIGWPALVVAVAAVSFVLRWPQARLVWTAADVAGVSLLTWMLALANNVVWAAVGATQDDWWWAGFNAAVGTVTAALVALLVAAVGGRPTPRTAETSHAVRRPPEAHQRDRTAVTDRGQATVVAGTAA